MRINMIGGGFQHEICSSALNKNQYVEWVKDGSSNISFYIDNAIRYINIDSRTKNYAWLMESSTIIGDLIKDVVDNIEFYKNKFEYIFTHDKRLLSIDSVFKYAIPNAKPWIRKKEIYNKTKNVSIIVSNKSGRPGYEFRLNYLNKIRNNPQVEHFGRGFINELPWVYEEGGVMESGKLLGLRDYRFSFAFENDNYDSAFCEKLTDCFATGTVPIFWGNPNIGDFFDLDGIIIFDDDLDISTLTEELYLSKQKSILHNFNSAINLPSAEDYIYLTYLK